MTGPLHCQDRQLCNYKPADRVVAFGNFFPEKCFLLMQCSIIFSPKYGHQHIRKCTLYQKRDENTDWCLRGSMQFIHLWSLGNVSSAGGKKSKNVAWKAWKPHAYMLLVQQPPCLTTRPRLLVSSVRSVQSGAGIHKSRLFSIMVVKLHLPFVLHLSERSKENRVNKENYLILGEINLKKK